MYERWPEAKEDLFAFLESEITRAVKEEQERIYDWAVMNGITHKDSFVALRDFLRLSTPKPNGKN